MESCLYYGVLDKSAFLSVAVLENKEQQRINRLGSPFMTLQWFKLPYICVQVITLNRGDAVESVSKFFER